MDVAGEIILEVQQLAKLYARRENALRRRLGAIAGYAFFGGRPPEIDGLVKHEFWALKDVSFDLKRGQALGVIGLNGSGKTTLLRILAGQILPDRGEVQISGTSASMIDLTAGFQPAATGLRNIFLRAAALGYTQRQTREMLCEIIAFSELGDALEAPMSTYSSGMKMRLAFSVMAMVQPDVLFIDEVLAVGDFRFRQKCLARVREMRANSAFVMVSHSMPDISRFCDRVIVLHKGQIVFEGTPQPAIELYESLSNDSKESTQISKAMGPTFENPDAIADVDHYWCDATGKKIEDTEFSDAIYLKVRFRSAIDTRNLNIGVPVWSENAFYVTGLSTEITLDKFQIQKGEYTELMLEIDGGVINPGVLRSVLGIIDGQEFLYRQPNPDLVIKRTVHPTWGAVTIPHRWSRIPAVSTSPTEQ